MTHRASPYVRRWLTAGLAVMVAAGWPGNARAAQEAALYVTGPSRASGYVRFVNTSVYRVQVAIPSSGQSLKLAPADDERISPFYPVPADENQRARIQVREASAPLVLNVTAEEFVTVTIHADASYSVMRESPEDFNALKARVAFFNASTQCPAATLRVRQTGAPVFREISPGKAAYRLVNPVRADLDVTCGDGGQASVDTLDFGALAAAKRYSVFLIPDGKGGGGGHLIGVEDKKAGR